MRSISMVLAGLYWTGGGLGNRQRPLERIPFAYESPDKTGTVV